MHKGTLGTRGFSKPQGLIRPPAFAHPDRARRVTQRVPQDAPPPPSLPAELEVRGLHEVLGCGARPGRDPDAEGHSSGEPDVAQVGGPRLAAKPRGGNPPPTPDEQAPVRTPSAVIRMRWLTSGGGDQHGSSPHWFPQPPRSSRRGTDVRASGVPYAVFTGESRPSVDGPVDHRFGDGVALHVPTFEDGCVGPVLHQDRRAQSLRVGLLRLPSNRGAFPPALLTAPLGLGGNAAAALGVPTSSTSAGCQLNPTRARVVARRGGRPGGTARPLDRACDWNVTPVSFLDLHRTTIIDRNGAAPETSPPIGRSRARLGTSMTGDAGTRTPKRGKTV